jgi:hypothetical protein
VTLVNRYGYPGEFYALGIDRSTSSSGRRTSSASTSRAWSSFAAVFQDEHFGHKILHNQACSEGTLTSIAMWPPLHLIPSGSFAAKRRA